jgi:hypothetical protein
MKEILKVTSEEGCNIIWGNDENFVTIEDTIIDHGRWSVGHKANSPVFQRGFIMRR